MHRFGGITARLKFFGQVRRPDFRAVEDEYRTAFIAIVFQKARQYVRLLRVGDVDVKLFDGRNG